MISLLRQIQQKLYNDALKMIFQVKDLGEGQYLLGWEIKQNKNRKNITITQEKYIMKVLKTDCRGVSTPIIDTKSKCNKSIVISI